MALGPSKKSKPLQLKRGTAKAFRLANIVLLEGQPAVEIDTFRLKIGDGRTRYNLLPYIGEQSKGRDGKSAYQIWRDSGYEGTVEDFFESLVGAPGKSTYEIWLSLGNEGTIVDFINSIQGAKGDKGDSAYQIWLNEGNTGSIVDFLNSLIGKSAYEIWLSLGNEGSEFDFIESLRGKSAYEIWKEEYGTPESTVDDYIKFMVTTSWGTF